MIMDRLLDSVERLQNPTVLGLDTRFDYLPEGFASLRDNVLADAAEAVWSYNRALIDGLKDIIPAVKVQAAYYEMYGVEGMKTFEKTLRYAADAGMIVMADVKRGDIGATAEAYADAYLSGAELGGRRVDAFPADIVTVNPYLGTDSIAPFAKACAKTGKGMFVLVKTSNPSGGELQDLACGGCTLYERVADLVAQWAAPFMGKTGYSSIGAVVGATYPSQGTALRKRLPGIYFLVPGYGAQGAKGADLAGCFDTKGHGAIVNASRSILCAHKQQLGVGFVEAARSEALRMKADILGAIGGKIG